MGACARQMSMIVSVRLCGLMPSNVFWQSPITALIPAIVDYGRRLLQWAVASFAVTRAAWGGDKLIWC